MMSPGEMPPFAITFSSEPGTAISIAHRKSGMRARVMPGGRSRRMVAKMKEMGHEVLYYENIEGGHNGAADHEQAAFMSALVYTFLWEQLR